MIINKTIYLILILVSISYSLPKNTQGIKNQNRKDTNINYLRDNHLLYKSINSNNSPTYVKNKEKQTLFWEIKALTKKTAIKLKNHIIFMKTKLKEDKNLRPWDSLFLI